MRKVVSTQRSNGLGFACRVNNRKGQSFFKVPVAFLLDAKSRELFLEMFGTSCRKETLAETIQRQGDIRFATGGGEEISVNVDNILAQHGPEVAKNWPTLLKMLQMQALQRIQNMRRQDEEHRKRTGKPLYDKEDYESLVDTD